MSFLKIEYFVFYTQVCEVVEFIIEFLSIRYEYIYLTIYNIVFEFVILSNFFIRRKNSFYVMDYQQLTRDFLDY